MIEYEVPNIGRGGTYGYLISVMDKYNIKPADIARALDMEPRTVDGWFEKPSLAVKRIDKIIRALDIILSKNGIDIVDAVGYSSRLYIHTQQVADAMRNSVNQICKTLDPLELQTLESIAWSLYQQEHPYPSFYETRAPLYAISEDEGEPWEWITAKCIPIWYSDNGLYQHDPEREAAERAHAEAEALANETIETTPDDPSGGRWDVNEQIQDELKFKSIAAEWRQWADSRPADMPMTPEFRQLLAILELEAPRDDQPGEAPMDPELAQLSAILQAEALKADPAADDAEEGAEPAQ